MTSAIGWDIGGANLKAARAEGGRIVAAVQLPCNPHYGLARLEEAIAAARERLGPAERHAVTMTAELSDAFETRAAGVASIAAIFLRHSGATHALFYAGAQGLVPYGALPAAAAAVASANWRASAEIVARRIPEALLIDIGSTTADLVPISGGAVNALGGGDAERLANGELVYSGLLRGDPAATIALAPLGGRWTPLLRENFATMADVHRLLGALPEGVDSEPAADGRPKTVEASIARLARLAGRDAAEASPEQWRAFASFLARAQIRIIEDQIALLRSRGAMRDDAPIVGAGVGRGLIARLADAEGRAYRDVAEFIDTAPQAASSAADCAPAAALALLL
ncbi:MULTISPECIES: hydantoinase/oxoprolinase family protein [Methylosinus]|uniref:H4MPT-linked C1 transfer pathway protein n=1 Tax=Methylosinus trichosporium (strain ATCC 35070 / NCIMB 11131 / UNIQEM 75 / OB3b) TaxID=595536 RepID=A0A2D2D1J6_METT3|nr:MULTISPECIES: hydantoinase/oxoprolinase family protein [Methylosinus]ATQ68847.1 H4MPT-linked C1 transfer pathway protein [Methylosinus trichosporium OB3b]OBS52252.1 H4MPT-linked C1 transfer pathway protein [Methylosinus sp. 3S-1]